jgi:hypothetical protein
MKVFNALNGQEVKDMLLKDFIRMLDSDSELKSHIAFPKFTAKVTIVMDIYPRTPADKIMEMQLDMEQVRARTPEEISIYGAGPAIPVTPPDAQPITITLTTENNVDIPDEARLKYDMPRADTPTPQIQFARRGIEVGTAAERPTIATGNRVRD